MDSSDRLGLLSALLLLSAAACGWEPPTSPASREAANHFWPPRVGEAYPNLKLLNTSGERVEPSSFRGRVILVEPIGMDCPACNAFAGGSRSGGFQGVRPQAGLPAVDEILRDYAGGHRPHHDLWRDLMPAIPGLLAEAEAGPAGRPRG
jgi:hypothetical protein